MLSVISSMATKGLLADTLQVYEQQTGERVACTAMGGVKAADAVRARHDADLIVLSAAALAELAGEGYIEPDTQTAWVASTMRAAVAEGAPPLDISSVPLLQAALLQAGTVGVSTGPSGQYLLQLFADWGLQDALKDRIVVAEPGIAVGSLIAAGKVSLGFQQLAEMINQPGIRLLDSLPSELQTTTIFSMGLRKGGERQADARKLLAYLVSPETAEIKRKHGLEPA